MMHSHTERPLRPIKDEAGHEEAIRVLNELLDKDRSQDEEDYMEVLGLIIHDYEERLYRDENEPSALDMLTHFIENRGLSQRQLSKETGIAESTISAILTGKRGISESVRRQLATFFKVSEETFL